MSRVIGRGGAGDRPKDRDGAGGPGRVADRGGAGRSGALSPDAWQIVGIHALFIAGVGLSTTFVNIFLWRHGGGLAVVARYHVALFVAFTIGAVLGGWVAGRSDRVVALRWGIAMHMAFFLGVLLLGTQSPAFALPLGALLGMGMGFYYLGCSVLMYDFSTRGSAHRLVASIDQARLAGMTLTPFLAGWVVDQLPSGHGYRLVFGASVLLFIVAAVYSRGLRSPARGAGSPPLHPEALGRGRPRWRTYLVAQGWRGLRDGVFLFLAGILVFERTRNEFLLGAFALGTGALTWATTMWVGARSAPGRQGGFLTVGVLGSVLAVAALVLVPGWTGIIIFGALESASLPLVAVPFSALSYELTGAGQADRRSVGYMVAREIPLNIGRLVGVALLLVAVQWADQPAALQYTLGGLSLANLAALWVLRHGVL